MAYPRFSDLKKLATDILETARLKQEYGAGA